MTQTTKNPKLQLQSILFIGKNTPDFGGVALMQERHIFKIFLIFEWTAPQSRRI
jgi:hypothetical protein